MKLLDKLGQKYDGPKFVVNNVANYYFHHEKEFWRLNDFPMPRPPFDEMWIEYKMPKTAYSKEVGETDLLRNVGIRDDVEVHFGGIVRSGEKPNTWIIAGNYWQVPKNPHDRIIKGGTISIKYSWSPNEEIRVYTKDKVPEGDEEANNRIASALYAFHPILMSFSFCNCKNVETVTVRAGEKLQKKRERNGKLPLQDHRVINILPFGKYFEPGARVVSIQDGAGEKLAIEIRRGNYARYGAEFGRGLLFGKYSGMFWRPSILKDSEKEYQVRELAGTSKVSDKL